ncbi:MAG: RloB domain-containing protein, partial [Erysipelotrichaceae bacterium]|nr:RloB domain-containing protein [Erysipelotrichaceae bacterium]
MVKRIFTKQRGQIRRIAKKMIVVGLEGKNVTETNYLNHFNTISRKYHITFSKGNATDPMGVVEDTIRTIGNSDFDCAYGDRAYCLIDTDYGKNREKDLKEAIQTAGQNRIEVLLTNPTFELWYLLHFRYSTKKYMNNDEVISELCEYIPNYQKKSDVFYRLEPYTS